MNKSKKFTILTALVVLFICVVLFFSSRKQDSANEIVISIRDYVLGSFLNELPEINKKLPNKIDDYTTLNLIKYEDKKIVSVYELASNSISVDLLEKIKPLVKKQACKDEMKKNLLEVDIDFLERYQNSSGELLFEFTVNKSECVQLQ